MSETFGGSPIDDVGRDAVWTCGWCSQENLVDATFCEACGKSRGQAPPDGYVPPKQRARRFLQRLTQPEERKRDAERVKVRFTKLSERVKGAITRESYREVLQDRSNPVTTMLIAFLVWGIFRMVGFVPLMILLRALAFLMGPLGLLLTLALAYVYSQHRAEIDTRVARMRARARAFRRVTVEAARSLGWVGGRLGDLQRLVRGESPPPPGERVRGARVRILEEDLEDELDTYEMPEEEE
ncbi:MAG: hypothetical protein FJX76_12590 [Armatimonadetes bacterium]|nr:hypothetical protein [Armatimonadota bacterium]